MIEIIVCMVKQIRRLWGGGGGGGRKLYKNKRFFVYTIMYVLCERHCVAKIPSVLFIHIFNM